LAILDEVGVVAVNRQVLLRLSTALYVPQRRQGRATARPAPVIHHIASAII
jgi:hypothetical protein